jgi:hypothetical protein
MRGHEIMHRTRELIEAQGYQVIYGDTDSTFVWLGQRACRREARASAARWSSTSTAGGARHLRRSWDWRARWSWNTTCTSGAS